MSDDVLELADRLWRGEVGPADCHPVSHLGGLAEIGDGVAFVPSFANVSAFDTPDGLMLVDTASSFVAASVHRDLRWWSASRLHTAVYSHGHIDHVFGLPAWAAESAERGWPEPVVVAHEALPARFDRYALTAGYNEVINQRQFGVPGLRWPVEYRYPDRTYRDTLTLDVGGTAFELRHTRRAKPTTTRSRGCLARASCAAATCSSGRRRTPATRRRCSATPGSGRPRCAG